MSYRKYYPISISILKKIEIEYRSMGERVRKRKRCRMKSSSSSAGRNIHDQGTGSTVRIVQTGLRCLSFSFRFVFFFQRSRVVTVPAWPLLRACCTLVAGARQQQLVDLRVRVRHHRRCCCCTHRCIGGVTGSAPSAIQYIYIYVHTYRGRGYTNFVGGVVNPE